MERKIDDPSCGNYFHFMNNIFKNKQKIDYLNPMDEVLKQMSIGLTF